MSLCYAAVDILLVYLTVHQGMLGMTIKFAGCGADLRT